MQLPIGISNFRELIESSDPTGQPYLFIDKSLFIKELLDDLTKVKLFTRPRRFGKTLNISMLHHFLASEVDGKATEGLFKHLKIAEHKDYVKNYQGKYPVIYITFKDITQEDNYENAYNRFCKEILRTYLGFQYLLASPTLGIYQKKVIESILEERATRATMQTSLLDLTHYLSMHHGIKPWILIDEYDTPVHNAYLSGYYNEMIHFMRGFLGAGLKDNSYLDKAVLTGILRISKESIFSGLNNISVYSLLKSQYGEYFGFTDAEVLDLLNVSKLDNMNEVRDWYNGYQAGEKIVYNPWSIIHYLKEGKLNAYWVNVSDNKIIKDLVLQSNVTFKSQFESLLQDKPIETFVDENITFNNLESNNSAIWSLLFMSGYLKANVLEQSGQGFICKLQIPNFEVKDLYRNIISQWLSGVNDPTVFNHVMNNLLLGNLDEFTSQLKNILLQSMSVYDIKGKEPEKFFHGFMLGLAATIDPSQYEILSNKEAGKGRFDIAILPKDTRKLGILMEIKSVADNHPDLLKESANEALNQITQREYDAILSRRGVAQSLKIGIAFCGKEVAVEHTILS